MLRATMNISVDDFLKKNPVKPQKKSKLFAFKNEIQQLREAGVTYAKITEFLKENGLSVSWLTVRQFVINHLPEIQKIPLQSNEKSEQRREKTVESSTVPVNQDEYPLEQLLAGITPENLHKEVEVGDSVGKEW